MVNYTQTGHPIAVNTPLGPDKLLLIGITGQETVSRLFHFQLELLATNANAKDVTFDKLLGQKIGVELEVTAGKSDKRYISGLCSRVVEGEQDTDVTSYHLEIVPQFWLWTRRAQSRIFQQMSAPDILKKVLKGMDPAPAFELQGTFEKRDFCVQYRETDFNFACRLMEEEGIYFFFKHTADGHQMVLSNSPQSHVDLPVSSKLIYETATGGNRPEERVFQWQKSQELRSGKYTLWDHTFELPHKHLEASEPILASVQAGKVAHKLAVGGNDKLELYDYPGEYAQRFDGVSSGGGDQSGDLDKIFQDNARTVKIRMQEEASASLVANGSSTCRQLVAGHKFSLERHFNADGKYVLNSVSHSASLDAYRPGSQGHYRYTNQFTCQPLELPFRPARLTPKPVVQGTQTAVVVGPPGEEIWPDKYGRVKVQFHWDREGKNDAKSSCWVRVTTMWAGKQWGMIHIPRIGQEVVIAFEEGDPDQPLIVGSVYNYEQMPPLPLPAQKTQSGIKSNTHKGGGYNELVFDDAAGKEQIRLHGQFNMDSVIENNETHKVGVDRTRNVGNNEAITVANDRMKTVLNNETTTVGVNRTEQVGSNETITVGANRSENVGQCETVTIAMLRTHSVGINDMLNVGAAQEITVGAVRMLTVGAAQMTNIGGLYSIDVGASMKVNVGASMTEKIAKKLTIDVGDEILIKTGAASLLMKKDGTIKIKGKDILIEGSGKITAKASGDMVLKGSKIGQN